MHEPLTYLAGSGLAPSGPAARWHGHHHEFVYPGRRIVQVPGRTWPHVSQLCTSAGSEWFADGAVLLCTGCGLDCT